MIRTVFIIILIFLAGCVSSGKKEVMKEMPVVRSVPEKIGNLLPLDELPVTQIVEEVKKREKFFSLSVTNMQIRNVLFVLARELPEYNVVVDPDVSGAVTVSFSDLSLEKVLTILLEPLGLEYAIEDNILRVSKPRMVTRTFEFVYVTSSRTSKSALIAITGGAGEEGSSASSGSIDTSETVNVWDELEAGIRDMLSGNGKLSTNRRVGYITVTDYRSNVKKIEDYIDFFSKRIKTQVLIRAKLLEITLDEGSQFGIDWSTTFKILGGLSGNTNPLTAVQDFAPPLARSTFPDAELFRLGIDGKNFDIVIRALETQGKVAVLSSPEVSILNGQKAIIRSVREDVVFQSEITQSTVAGGLPIITTTAEPFTFGVYLDVTPHVGSDGVITLNIHPSVSSLVTVREFPADSPTARTPVIDTRETETIVDVKDGETVIIAGLMKNDSRKDISRVPLLGGIPYLGKVFRREIEVSEKSELIILLSPTIVGPRASDFGNIREKYRMLRTEYP